MTTRRSDLAPPRPGDVIRYADLWTNERDAGREEGVKDRPCAVVLTIQETDDNAHAVFVLPITSRRPANGEDAEELSLATRSRLGLQAAPCWVVLSEVNRFYWPGPDLRPVERPDGPFYRFGMLPAVQTRRIRDAVLKCARVHRLGVVQRTE
jgi:hypothetical protein